LLVQFPRHHKDKIILKSKVPLTVYRMISSNNDNLDFKGYEKTGIKVKVIGGSTKHTQVVKKTFNAGIVSLSPGRSVSTSPILISIGGWPSLELVHHTTNHTQNIDYKRLTLH
jgi:hypothetical protein